MANSPLETDPRFWVLSEALASYAGDPDDRLIPDGDHLQAAVALVLRAGRNLDLLLIKRAQSERDPWSGHMALPGGRKDEADGNLQTTAVREALEETGLDLKSHGPSLGRLNAVTPVSTRLPKLTISPFVFGVPRQAEAHVASHEIEQVFWVSIDELRAVSSHSEVEIPLPGGPAVFPCYRVAGEVVWGLTYRILSQFLKVYPDPELDRLTKG